jgi:ABC-type multidrug transport system permease subunit
VFVFPIHMAAGLGIAFRSRPPAVVQVAVVAGGAAAETARATLAASKHLDVRLVDGPGGELELRTGKVALLVVPDSRGGFEYRFDDTRPEGVAARRIVDDVLQRGAGRSDPVASRDVVLREPGSRYIDFLVPGLVGMNIMASGIWGLGFSIVDARQKKLLKRLVATPMSRADYLLSHLFARIAVVFVSTLAILVFGVVAFQVPVRGSLAALAWTCLLSGLTFGALGLLIASRARTIEAVSGLMNFAMLPMWVFSGVFFSSSRFPEAAQPFIQALPLTAVNDALRANMLEGAGFTALGPELGILAAWLAGCFAIALAVFRWR